MTRLFEAKPFIIAEVGSNWTTLSQCKESIRVAKECGADAVKYQAFDWPSLYGVDQIHVENPERIPDKWAVPRWMKMPHELDLRWLPDLKAEADRVGIEFMCTAFSPELVAVVDPYVLVHKVASSDAAWPQMLWAVWATGRPVLISVGAKTAEEINQIEKTVPGCVLMSCTAAYPADFSELEAITYETRGFSDHTLGYTAAVEAARLGAIVIEKHFTAFPDLQTPDRPHSLTPAQFTRMVKLIRGEPVESEETAMFLRANRRLIATKSLAAGDTLTYGENFGAFRSLKDDTRGASPFDWEKLQGKRVKLAVERGDGIAVEDVE